jgi:putative resolvase
MARSLKTGKSPNRAIVYCRVSSSNQKDDLASQVKAMEQFCLAQGVAITDSIQEIGGGLNFKRPKGTANCPVGDSRGSESIIRCT